MTEWSAREIEADLSFLAQGSYRALSCEDAINADQHVGDYEIKNELVSATDKLRIKKVQGGGYVVKLIKVDGKQ
jgi:alpha-glucosidase